VSENVEVIERLYDAWNRGDVAGILDLCDPDIVVRPAYGAMLSSAVYRGKAGVESWYADTFEPWAELRVVPRRFVEAHDRTLVVVELHARVPGGQVEIADEIAHLVSTAHGRIVRLDGYDDPHAALADLGLEE
jgi:ketosteroid isomerase-like protein